MILCLYNVLFSVLQCDTSLDSLRALDRGIYLKDISALVGNQTTVL